MANEYEDKYLHVRKLEDYHPGYKDRTLQWAKIYFRMVQGDPDCELIENEIDWSRLVKFILLELQAQKPIPLCTKYLVKKNFDLKKRPIDLTINMLHNFIEVVTLDGKLCVIDKDKEEDKDKNKSRGESVTKIQYAPSVMMTEKEYNKLIETHGEELTTAFIEKLSNYKEASGKKYKSDYAAMHTWVIERVKEDRKKKETFRELPRC